MFNFINFNGKPVGKFPVNRIVTILIMKYFEGSFVKTINTVNAEDFFIEVKRVH